MTTPYVSYETLKSLAITSAGYITDVSQQTDVDAASDPSSYPSPTKADVAELPAGTIVALYDLLLRVDPSTYTAEVRVSALDDSATYTVNLDSAGNRNYAASGGDSKTDVLDGLKSAIDAAEGGTYNTSVAADADGEPTLTIQLASGRTPYTCAVSATGSGVLTADVDATSIEYEIWLRVGSGALATWRRVSGEDALVATENVGERLDVAGFTAADLRIISTDGRVKRIARPGVLEV